jgi:hypothetical protein
MQSTALTTSFEDDWILMSPVTWEQHTPAPELDIEIDSEQRTEQTPDFELSDFGDDTHERTTIAVAAYDFRPKIHGS